ncbi:efflux RND transporter periplasmic adaptor subunit [Formosa sp. 4Alg 33]|uniref:efflux RND transporter periplasmic adaptor subunit n=1 Tax=Formosa sp. 4Alg 33 TaxID=3382189 RepID=UPI003D9C28E6
MKRNTIYIVFALILGLILGYLMFGRTATSTIESHNHEQEASLESNEMWTCSMHPQIMKTEAGDCPICGMDLIPVTTDDSGLTAQQFKLSKNAIALANIETTVIGAGTNGDTNLKLSGTIKVNDDKVFVQPAHFNGRIDKLYVTSVGQKVHKGQLVATIYSPDLIRAQQELITAYKMKASQPELYSAVRTKFKNWMIHGGQLDEIEKSGQVVNQFKIYAHVSGTVSEISAKEGDHVMDGKAIFKVSNLSTVWAAFDAYENQIQTLKVGQSIDIVAKAYPNKVIPSKITFIDPILEASTRTVTVRTVLENKEGLFKPGMFVEGAIANLKENKAEVLTIPVSAVMWTGKRSVVYLKVNVDEPVFEMRDITLGSKLGAAYEVINGLALGDIVVTNGTFTVDAAAQLKGKSSMMNQNNVSHDVSDGIENDLISDVKVQEAPEIFQKQLEVVLLSYIQLKDNLVNSDFESAKNQASQLLKAVKDVDTKSISEDRIMMTLWDEQSTKIENNLTEIQSVKDLATFRNVFSKVSLDVKHLIELYGVSFKVYVQFCPMSNQNKGGYWLSLEEKIKNPYYGAVMLECGENDKIIE